MGYGITLLPVDKQGVVNPEILENGDYMVGDLQPMEYIDGYEGRRALQADWNQIMSRHPNRILYAHIPEMRIKP